MTEDLPRFRQPSRWVLSGRDLKILGDLHETLRFWLPACKTANQVIAFGQMLAGIEGLIEGEAPGRLYEAELDDVHEALGGRSASVAVGPSEISLNLYGFTPGQHDGFEHEPVYSRTGVPLSLTLDMQGSFDGALFAEWCDRVVDMAPEGARDPVAKVTIKADVELEGFDDTHVMTIR